MSKMYGGSSTTTVCNEIPIGIRQRKLVGIVPSKRKDAGRSRPRYALSSMEAIALHEAGYNPLLLTRVNLSKFGNPLRRAGKPLGGH